MLKPIFDEDVDFFSKKKIWCAKGGDFKKGALDSDFMFVLYISKPGYQLPVSKLSVCLRSAVNV